MVARGDLLNLGIGVGDALSRITGECMFGARFQMPPTATLQQVVDTLSALEPLALSMAAVP